MSQSLHRWSRIGIALAFWCALPVGFAHAIDVLEGVDRVLGIYVAGEKTGDRYMTGYVEFRPDHTWTRVTHADLDFDNIPDDVRVEKGTFGLKRGAQGAELTVTAEDGSALESPSSLSFRDKQVMAFRWFGLSYARKLRDQPYFNYVDNTRPKAKAVLVKSDPAGATVFFDGQAQADKTPMTIQEPDAGVEHEIRVELPQYMPGVRTMTLKENERAEVFVDLREGLAELWVKTTPRMHVIVDGKLKGESPVKINDLSLGEHVLQVSLPAMGVEKSEKVLLERGQVLKRTYRFMGTLEIDVGRGAEVRNQDGRVLGSAPSSITLPVGRHVLTLKDAEGREKRVSVDVRLGETTALRTDFDAIP